MKTKNSYVELLRFIFMGILLLHHTGNYGLSPYISNCPSGYIIVEFFYILVGCFAMRHIAKEGEKIANPMRYSMGYTLNKLKRLFPYALISTLVCYVWYIIDNYDSMEGIKDVCWAFTNMFYETFFLTFSGAFPGAAANFKNAPLWFLAGMLMALPIIMYIAIKCEDFFKHYLVWFAPTVIFGWLITSWGNFAVWDMYKGFLYGGVWRAFADITLGCAAYYISEYIAEYVKLKKLDGNSLFTAFLTVFEVGIMAMCVYSCTIWPETYHLVTIIIFMAIGLGIEMSGCTYTSRMRVKALNYIGSLTMPIYCIHWPVMLRVNEKMEGASVEAKIGVYVGITIVAAVVLKLVIDVCSKKIQNRNNS